ncbi:MAG: helix-turn-helix domain-containing protein [Brachybacterium sp.]|uniref:helix-turn-helix domain-containing protein n=1 Tax=Brachybacterium sp. AOP42-E1-35 TaxID=3457664 RepID=UPI003FBA38C2
MVDMDARQLGARVREARSRKDLSQGELAERVGLERTAINKIETGMRKVAALELSDIADALGLHMSSFFEDPAPALVSHRSSQGLDTVDSTIDAHLERLANDAELVKKLGALDLSQPQRNWPVLTSKADAEVMAKKARSAIGADSTSPLLDITRHLAKLGLLVFARDLGVDTADAGTLLLREGGLSLVNSANKVGRRRLAVAHELAHYLAADDYTVDWRVSDNTTLTEARFDYFARAFLLPPNGLRARWSQLHEGEDTRAAAVIIASEYRVDMSTLARRLLDLAIIDTSVAAEIRSVRTTATDIVEFDLLHIDELAGTAQPRVYQRAVLKLLRDEKISRERALDLLWETFSESDLPQPRVRDAGEIWQYVS